MSIDLDKLQPGQRSKWVRNVAAYKSKSGVITWYIRVLVNGRQVPEKVEHALNMKQAIKALEVRRVEVFQGTWKPKARKTTIAEYAETFFKEKDGLATVGKYQSQWRNHLKKVFGAKAFDDVTVADCERYRRAREEAGAAPATARNELRCLQSMFVEAKKERLTVNDPVAAMNFNIDNQRKRVLTDDERQRVITAAYERDNYVRPLVLLLLFTGFRISHACRLRWNEFDLANRVLHTEPDKNGKSITMPLVPALVDTLLWWHERCPSEDWVFPGHRNKKIARSRAGVRGAIAAVLRDANAQGLWTHDFRRTFVTEVRSNGGVGAFARALIGHSSEAMTEHYHIPKIETLRGMVEALPGSRDLPLIYKQRDAGDETELVDRKNLIKITK